MKAMMMIMSLMVLVSCNGGGGNNNKNNKGGSSSSAYSEKQIDALNCNEEILGWAENPPLDKDHALFLLEAKPEFEECGHFDLYIDEVLLEYPKAVYLKEIKKAYQDYMANGGNDSDDGEQYEDEDDSEWEE